MITFLIPFVVFIAVMLIMLLVYLVWTRSGDKTKKERIEAIHNAVHMGGQQLSSLKTLQQDSVLEAWLRSRSGLFRQFENLVERAYSPISAGRLMVIMLALFMVAVLLGLLRQTNLFLLVVIATAIASTPVLWLFRKAGKCRTAFEAKLPEALDYITRALRAGQSISAAIGMVGKEFSFPIGQEFKTVFDEIAFGIPFKDAIVHLSERVRSKDLNFFVISVTIQHETGGNLTELLDGLARTMRERVKFRGKVRTLSSEGRASAWVLGCLPFAMIGLLSLISPSYISLLWTTPQGHIILFIVGGLMTFGMFVINSLIQIKV
jgi:tight adherence protein B